MSDDDALLHRLDPDHDHVPLELRLHEGAEAYGPDGDPLGTVIVAPGLFGHAARLRERPETP